MVQGTLGARTFFEYSVAMAAVEPGPALAPAELDDRLHLHKGRFCGGWASWGEEAG